jgi:hypothetical protein
LPLPPLGIPPIWNPAYIRNGRLHLLIMEWEI